MFIMIECNSIIIKFIYEGFCFTPTNWKYVRSEIFNFL